MPWGWHGVWPGAGLPTTVHPLGGGFGLPLAALRWHGFGWSGVVRTRLESQEPLSLSSRLRQSPPDQFVRWQFHSRNAAFAHGLSIPDDVPSVGWPPAGW